MRFPIALSQFDPVPSTAYTAAMNNNNTVLFHIARRAGLEFVVTSGHALRYPLHTHISVWTVTLVQRGAVRLSDGRSAKIYPSGSTYIVAPHQPHSPAYSDNFAFASLCVRKALLPGGAESGFSEMKIADLLALVVDYGRHLAHGNLLSGEDIQAIAAGVRFAHEHAAAAQAPDRPSPEALLSQSGASASPYRFIRHFKRATGLTPH